MNLEEQGFKEVEGKPQYITSENQDATFYEKQIGNETSAVIEYIDGGMTLYIYKGIGMSGSRNKIMKL